MSKNKETLYQELVEQIDAVLADETDALVWMSTLSCLIRRRMGFFWVGFYVVHGEELRVGPYQGTLGCLRIPFSRGVCGAAARAQQTVRVANVREFPGHIACDSCSQSEIVVPVFDDKERLRAVLDIDSDQPATFDSLDQNYLERIISSMKVLEWNAPS